MFKYRFYYSEQQKRVMANIGQDGKSFVVLSTGMEVEYTEMCSSPDSKCNWEDARLIYASDTEPQISHEWGEQEKEEWELLFREAEDYYSLSDDEEIDWEDLPDLDEPDDMLAGFEAYEHEADVAWDEWMDNRPGPENEVYVRGQQFNQDT